MTIWKSFLAGVQAQSPILIGAIPFALVFGATASSKGIPPIESMLMSVIVFAGAAQLVAVQLMATHAPLFVIVMAGIVVNLRFLMYSASLAPHLSEEPIRRRVLTSYLLTDQAFAICMAEFTRDARQVDRFWFYMGAGLTLWVGWQCGTAAGVVLGASIPAHWPLGFAIPLTFLVLLIPVLTDRPKVIAACVSGLVALAAHGLPYSLGIVIAAASGILAGYYMETRR